MPTARIRLFSFFVLVVAFLAGPRAASAEQDKVVVLPFNATNVPPDTVDLLNTLLPVSMSEHSPYAVRTLAYPSVYNLLIDPKEEVPELNYLADTWVDAPLYQVLEDFQASLEKDRGTPDP